MLCIFEEVGSSVYLNLFVLIFGCSLEHQEHKMSYYLYQRREMYLLLLFLKYQYWFQQAHEQLRIQYQSSLFPSYKLSASEGCCASHFKEASVSM